MRKITLIFIILLAAFLRFWQLGSYPALNADEAAIGYNAYSLIETGKDEHGNPWPVHFQSFNDYKPGLYFYIVLPFVKLFGLNAWSVRFPGALMGVGTVLLIYLLVKHLSLHKRSEVLAQASAFFLAISPWHIHFSRGGWEVNAATFFITLGLLFFLRAIRSKKLLHYSLFAISLSLSLYIYHAARVVVPLLGLGLLAIYHKNLKSKLKYFSISLAIGALILLPLFYDLTKGSVLSRAAGVGLFADPGPLNRINQQRGEHNDLASPPAVLFHNKATNYGLAFLQNWSQHYWGEFLFLSGDIIERNRVPETGQMYYHDLLFLAAAFIAIGAGLTKSKKMNKGMLLIIWWLLVAPTAAALTFQSPHALRAQNMVIPLSILSAYGLVSISFWLHKVVRSKRALNIIFILFIALISWGFTRYLHMYWVHMAKEYPFSSQYGVSELVTLVKEQENGYDTVVVTDRYDQPYILFLFYTKYPPEKFQSEHVLTSPDIYGFSTVREYGKYRFVDMNWDTVQPKYPNSLIAGTDEEIPDEANVTGEIFGSNGYKYFDVVAN